MNPPSGALPEDSTPTAPPLGPAISRPVAGSAPPEEVTELLPPFVPPRAASTSEAAAAPAPTAHDVRGEGGTDMALGEVAERLERIAAGLRRGSPAELLTRVESDDAEPLEVLITGYALGYAEARRRG